MFFVDDVFYSQDYVSRCFEAFDNNPILRACHNKRFTVCVQDTAQWLALCLYFKKNGASVFPLPIDTPIDAARRRAQMSASHYLIYAKNTKGIVDAIEPLAVGGTDSRAGADAGAELVQMSSGTTGEPKTIARTWQSIDIEINAYLQHFPEANAMTPVVAAPVSHSYGLICGVLVAFSRGATPHIVTNLNPKYILRKISEIDQPILYSSPALISTLSLLIKPDKKVHAIMTSGTLLQGACFDRVKSATQFLFQQYGCSEVGCISLAKHISAYNDIGTPLPHHQVYAGDNASVPAEIIVRNSQGDKVSTNDIAYFDKRGSLHYVSRIDDMINVAGLNVYPVEVEERILTMPHITDAVVYKRTHMLGNDQVCLQFVADESANIAVEDIRQWCRTQLSTYQVPMHIERVEKINKLASGKVNRKQLAELH